MKEEYGTKVNEKLKEMYQHKDLSGFNVLDLGSGEGANSKFLADRGAKVIAIDNNKEIKIKYKNVYFSNSDLKKHARFFNLNIILAINVLQFLSIKEIKKVFPYLLDSVVDNGILFLEMFDSPAVDWINTQIEDFKVMDYKKWEQKDTKPFPHKHNMIRWILKK